MERRSSNLLLFSLSYLHATQFGLIWLEWILSCNGLCMDLCHLSIHLYFLAAWTSPLLLCNSDIELLLWSASLTLRFETHPFLVCVVCSDFGEHHHQHIGLSVLLLLTYFRLNWLLTDSRMP